MAQLQFCPVNEQVKRQLVREATKRLREAGSVEEIHISDGFTAMGVNT